MRSFRLSMARTLLPRGGKYPDAVDLIGRHRGAGDKPSIDKLASIEIAEDCGVSFDDLVGAREDRWWHRQPERIGGLQIDHQCELGRVLNR